MAREQSTTEALGLSVLRANGIQRFVQKMAATRPCSWLLQRTVYPFDKVLYKRSNGRVTLPGLLAGIPVVMLTTVGVKSGEKRTIPLLGIPMDDGSVAVIGSNFGQKSTPGWVYNLRANPTARVGFRGRHVGVRARRANADEAEIAFAAAAPIYGGFASYRTRATHRTIEVFLLDPDVSEPADRSG